MLKRLLGRSREAETKNADFIRGGWDRYSRFPGGARLFSRWISRLVPYTGSIRPEVLEAMLETFEGAVTAALEGRRPTINGDGGDRCHRSVAAYAHRVAASTGLTLRFQACSGARLVDMDRGPVKLLGTGDADRSYTVRGVALSASARAKIEAAGGTVSVIESATAGE